MQKINLAYFVSAHGYGHAARACAVMNRILKEWPEVHFLIFTQVTQWFFEDSLPKNAFAYFETFTDVGFVQKSPFKEDLHQTLRVLSQHLPFSKGKITSLAEQLLAENCKAVLCDVSALGILAAQRANLPSVLIENFTWDWLYRHYEKEMPAFSQFANYLNQIYTQSSRHIQAIPFTKAIQGAFAVPPISRRPKHSFKEIRKLLAIPNQANAVLISTGGIKTRHKFVNKLKAQKNVYFIVPHDVKTFFKEDNLIVLPHHSSFYHPDLVLAADVVVCKSGYSTVAEAYFMNKPLALIKRPDFPESSYIEAFVQKHFVHQLFEPECFISGCWIDKIPLLLEQAGNNSTSKKYPNGADEAAQIIKMWTVSD